MKKLLIQDKLESLGVALDTINLGDFDYIGRFTAERQRSPDDPNYKKYGFTYRSNYERGILIYYLIRKLNITSMLEIGFGRGYATFCAARAFADSGIDGKITTVDPALKEEYVNMLHQVFPHEWFKYINFCKGTSQEILPKLEGNFDFAYIDGDHSYGGTKLDWELVKNRWNKCVLFDDYHLPSKVDAGIQCREAIDEIVESEFEANEKELILLDRRIFFDDRRLTDDQIDYGQVLLTKSNVITDSDW